MSKLESKIFFGKVLASLYFLIFFVVADTQELANDYNLTQAAAYIATKQYDQAIGIYQNMLQQPQPSWQRGVLLYNLGYALLQAGDLDQAISTFQSVPLNNELYPLLNYRTQINQSVANFRKALSQASTPQQEIDLLSQTLLNLSEVQRAFCILNAAEGDPKCENPTEIVALRSGLKQALANASLQEEQRRLHATSLREGLALLLSEINFILPSLDWLETSPLSEEQQQAYRELFSKEALEALSLWNSVSQVINKDTQGHFAQRNELFEHAKILFQQGVQLLASGNLTNSKTSLSSAAENIRSLLAMLPPPPPVQKPDEGPAETQAQTMEKQSQVQQSNAQVLQSLLEMEQQDTMPITQPPLQKQVLRPW